MADYDEEIPDEEKVKIASDFILHAPPGEFNEVFNDVRVLLNNDALLKEGASGAFAKYNEDQFTPAKVEGAEKQVIVASPGLQADGTYIDPRTKQTFNFDHLRKEATPAGSAEGGDEIESFRAAFEKAADDYVEDHYPNGVSSTYGKGNVVTVCIEDHKFQPNNFWNGRWCSQWTFDKSSGETKGVLRARVHYYEDGNVQLQSVKEVTVKIPVSDEAATAKKFAKVVADAENEYQSAISSNYNAMSDTTFKALRRALPITRTKVDWNKILNYKIGKELSHK